MLCKTTFMLFMNLRFGIIIFRKLLINQLKIRTKPVQNPYVFLCKTTIVLCKTTFMLFMILLNGIDQFLKLLINQLKIRIKPVQNPYAFLCNNFTLNKTTFMFCKTTFMLFLNLINRIQKFHKLLINQFKIRIKPVQNPYVFKSDLIVLE